MLSGEERSYYRDDRTTTQSTQFFSQRKQPQAAK